MAALADLFVRISGDDSAAQRTIKGVLGDLQKVDRTRVRPTIEVPEKAAQDLKALSGRLEALGRQRVKLTVDAGQIGADVRTVRGQIERLTRQTYTVPLEAQGPINQQIETLQRELDGLERKERRIPLTLERLDARVAQAKVQLADLERSAVEVPVQLTGLAGVQARLARLRSERIVVPVSVDAQRLQAASAQFASLLRLPAIAAGAALAGGAVASLTAGVVSLGAAAAPAVGALAGVGVAGAALGQGLAVAWIATSGLGDAFKAQTVASARLAAGQRLTETESKKLAETFQQLSPAARGFVQQAGAMQQRLLGIRGAVQATLLPELGRSVQVLGNAYIPTLNRAAVGTAGVLRDLARQATAAFSSRVWRQDVERILSTNVRLLRTLGGAAVPLANVVRNIWVAALPLAGRFAEAVRDGAVRLSNLTQRARDSGALGRFFRLAGDTAAQLGRIIGNVAAGLLNVGRAAFGAGRQLLTSLEGATRRMREFTGSAEGAAKLRGYFQQAVPVVKETGRLVGALISAFARLGSNPALAPLIRQIRTELLPAFERLLAGVSGEFGPRLVELGTRLVNIFTRLTAGGGALNAFLSTLNRMAAAFERILASPLGPVVQQLLTIAGTGAALGLVAGSVGRLVGTLGTLARLTGFAAVSRAVLSIGLASDVAAASTTRQIAVMRLAQAAAKAWTAVQVVLNAALRNNPIGLVITALGLLTAGLVLAYRRSETFRSIVDGAFRRVADAGRFMWERVLRPAFNALGDVFIATQRFAGDLWRGLSDKFRGGARFIAARMGDAGRVFEVFRDTVSRVVDRVGGFLSNLQQLAGDLWRGLRGKFLEGARFIGDRMIGAVETILGVFGKLPGRLGEDFRKAQGHVAQFRQDFNTELDRLADEEVRVTAVANVKLSPEAIKFAQAIPTGGRLRIQAEGSVMDFLANGGLRENHVAQIARPGDMRLWAEPETGGEAYIPLAPSKRARSVSIWQETGRRLGQFAEGGLVAARGDVLGQEDTERRLRQHIQDTSRRTATVGHVAAELAAKDIIRTFQAAASAAEQQASPSPGDAPAFGGTVRGRRGAYGGVSSFVAGVGDAIQARFGRMTVGGFVRRNIAGTGRVSDHGLGKALDFMTYRDKVKGQRIADFLVGNSGKFRADNVIFNRRIWGAGRGWRPYRHPGGNNPTLNHEDHVHYDTFDRGGLAVGRGLIPKQTLQPERVLPPRETIVYEKLLAALLRMEQAPRGHAYGLQGGRTGPLVHVERVESTVDLELIARQAEFRERAGAFT